MIATMFLTACTSKQPQSMIKAKRRLAEYLPNENSSYGGSTSKPTSGVIDLSEGPRLKYQADFGPKNLDFDIKIESSY